MGNLFSELKDWLTAKEAAEAKIELAAGEPKIVELARSGTYHPKVGGETTFTPEHLAGLAARFDADGYHKLKIGHVPIDTDYPNYGDVTALAYDEKADILRATVVPRPALIRKNQEEGFTRVSMELAGRPDKLEEAKFTHLAFLGAHPPAILGLEEVSFAAAGSSDPVMVFAAAEPEKKSEGGDLTREVTLPLETETSSKVAEEKMADDAKFAELEAEKEKQKIELAATTARLERFEKRAKENAENEAKIFCAANVKRIPMLARKAGFESGLAALLAQEATKDAATIQFAAGDGEKTLTPAEFVMAMFAAMPEQVTTEETKETATTGADLEKRETGAEFAGADPESVTLHFAVEAERADAKSKGEMITYLEATRRVERSRRAAK